MRPGFFRSGFRRSRDDEHDASVWSARLRGLFPALIFLLSFGSTIALAQEDRWTFEVYKDKAGEYRWRLKAANSKIIAIPEDAYKTHGGAKSAIQSLQNNIAKYKVEYYQDKGKQHRWRLKATNGSVMARASEGYKTKEGAEKAFGLVEASVKSATIVEAK